MKLGRQLARMLAAMIVMIIAHLAPSAVLAHAGHHHESPAVVSSSGATPAPAVISFGSYGAVTPSALAIKPAEADAAVGVADRDTLAPLKTCMGSCCCSTGMACCVHALTAEIGSAGLIGAAAHLIVLPEDLARPGVDPEALPKPPRSFA